MCLSLHQSLELTCFLERKAAKDSESTSKPKAAVSLIYRVSWFIAFPFFLSAIALLPMLRTSPWERRGIGDKGEPAASSISASPQFLLWQNQPVVTRGPALRRWPDGFFLSSQHPPLTKLNPQFQTRAEGFPRLLVGVDRGRNTHCPVTFSASSLGLAGDTPSFGPWFGKKFMFLNHVYVFPTISISYILIHLTCKTDCDVIIVVDPSLSLFFFCIYFY